MSDTRPAVPELPRGTAAPRPRYRWPGCDQWHVVTHLLFKPVPVEIRRSPNRRSTGGGLVVSGPWTPLPARYRQLSNSRRHLTADPHTHRTTAQRGAPRRRPLTHRLVGLCRPGPSNVAPHGYRRSELVVSTSSPDIAMAGRAAGGAQLEHPAGSHQTTGVAAPHIPRTNR